MNEQTNINVEKLRPFTKLLMTIGTLPTSYLMSMTYLEQVTWFCNYLQNVVIPTINNNAQAVEELQNIINNIDLQDEVDNKLDEMAESGQLTDIIAQYLDLAGVLAYNTISDMANAENLTNGSICYTLGNISYNDGDGAFYKIRNVTTGDVIDGYLIVTIINDNTLIGERILKAKPTKKYLILGDSYAEGYTPDGNVTGWAELLKNLLGLNSSNCTIKYRGGCGFTPTNNTYTDLINTLANDNKVTDIIVAGGYNDRNASYESILAGSLTFKTACNTKFPNANIYLGFIGFTNTNERYSFNKCRDFYVKISSIHNYKYLNNVEYSLKHSYRSFASDNYHPNQTGQNKISSSIFEAYKTGSATVTFEYLNLNLEVLSTFNSITQAFVNSIGSTVCNEITTLSMQSFGNISSTNGVSITCNGTQKYEVATITNGYITGTNYNTINIPVSCVVKDISGGSSKYYAMQGILYIENKKLSISLIDTNDTLNNYRTLSQVTQIQVFPFSASFDSLFC